MTFHLQVQEGAGPVVVTECLCDPRCEEGCCAVRIAVNSDDSSDSETADENTPLLVCHPTAISPVCLLFTSTSHSAFKPFNNSAYTANCTLCSSHSPSHFQLSGDDEPIRCACHVRQPNKTSTKARNKLIVACMLALLFMIGEVVGKGGRGWACD